jgi:hypothetical protein
VPAAAVGEGQTVGVHPDDTMSRRLRLAQGERLLWSDRPRQGIVLRTRDAFLVPLGLLWAAGVAMWIVQAWRAGAQVAVQGLGVVALLAGLWLGVGRLLADSRVRALTRYGISDRRVIELREGRRGGMWSVSVRDLDPVDCTVHRDGTATIEYGPMHGPERDLRVLPAAANWWPESRPRIEMVPNGRWVYELLCGTGRLPVQPSRSST